MPTKKPRITITITDEQYAVLQDLSNVTGQSMSAAVVDLLETALPVLSRVAAVLEAAKNAPKEMRSGIAESFRQVEEQMMPLLAATNAQLEASMGKEAVDQIKALAAEKGQRPPPTNRGVRLPTQESPKPSVHAVSKVFRKGAKK